MNSACLFQLLRVVIGGVFIYSGAVKALDPSQFLRDIEGYRLAPYSLGVAMATYLPWLEILGGGCLAARRLYSGALSILLLLMMIFTLAILAAWFRGLDISCGCFAHGRGLHHYAWWVFRDLVILTGLGALAISQKSCNKGNR